MRCPRPQPISRRKGASKRATIEERVLLAIAGWRKACVDGRLPPGCVECPPMSLRGLVDVAPDDIGVRTWNRLVNCWTRIRAASDGHNPLEPGQYVSAGPAAKRSACCCEDEGED